MPWAAVAAELGTDPTCAEQTVGRAFTFLPLPVKTGLPVHVNAYFELSSNRRDIWFGGDMAGGGAARSEWNQALLSKVVAPCYARLVIACAGKLGPSPAFYALLPETNPPEPWGCVVRELYRTLTEGDAKVLHTPANGGRWIAPKDAVYPDPSLASDDILRDALVAEGLTLTDAPGGVLERIEEHAVRNPKRVSPAGVRQTLREKGEDGIGDRPRERVLVLLRYVLSDIIDDEPASAAELDGVPLFPLADGSTAVVRPGGVGAKALYVPDETECRFVVPRLRQVRGPHLRRRHRVQAGDFSQHPRVEPVPDRRRRRRGLDAEYLAAYVDPSGGRRGQRQANLHSRALGRCRYVRRVPGAGVARAGVRVFGPRLAR